MKELIRIRKSKNYNGDGRLSYRVTENDAKEAFLTVMAARTIRAEKS